MATHNQVRVVGFLLGNVRLVGNENDGTEKAFFTIRTTHRDVDCFHEEKFEDIMIYYDGEDASIMNKIKKLVPYDIVDIKGVFNILTMNKRSKCSSCGAENIKYQGSSTFIYPLHLFKQNALFKAYEYDENRPEELLVKHYKEISNQAIICGTVVNEPELKELKNTLCCKYMLGVNRKYYIKTQGNITADYPWVYTFGQQAEDDYRHLIQGSSILMDGFIRTRKVMTHMSCSACGAEYEFPDVATEFIPYSIEYLKDYLTDEDIAAIEADEKREQYENAKRAIFQ